MKVVIFYVLTRMPFVKNVFFSLLNIMGKRGAVDFFREKCSCCAR